MKKLTTRQLVLMFLSITTLSFGQYYEESSYSGIGVPYFEYTLSRQFDPIKEKPSVLVISQILNDDLTFVKSDTSGFDAAFEWLIALYNDEDQLLFSRTITKRINITNYEETNSHKIKSTLKSSVAVDPGKYKILMRMIDLNSNQPAQRKKEIEVEPYIGKELAVSDILVLDKVSFDSSGNILDYNPVMANNLDIKTGKVFLYINIYSKNINTTANVSYKFFNHKNRIEIDRKTTKEITDKVTPFLLQVDRKLFKSNKYNIKIKVKVDKEEAETERKMTFYWKSVPSTSYDINLAFRQMVYVLNSDTLNHYLEAELEEKQAFFKRFWKERDPNPKTKKNELMDEYFRRINYANINFSGLSLSGWETDRGRILIKFGYPDDVERHPFELESKPYEIWRYHSLRKVFLFEDDTGFGTYRLHHNYVNVEFE